MSSNKKLKKSKPGKSQKILPSKPESERTAQQKLKAEKQWKGPGHLKPVLPGSWLMNTGIFFLFVIGTAILYAGDLHLDFFKIDDQQYVVNNPWIRSINPENINHILSNSYFVNYSPVHLFSYIVDYAIGGSNAYGFHLSSNIWAGLGAGFVYLVGLALTGRRIVAVLAAVLFVVHPVHVEAIAWISSRKDLVATAFILPSLLAYLYYRRGGKTSIRWYIASLILFLFAIGGKLSVAVFPAVFFAIDLFLEKRLLIKSLIDKIPFLLIAIGFAMAVSSAQPGTGVHPDAAVPAMAFGQSMWLLTGFGKYVIYRVAPQPTEMGGEIIAAIILISVFLAPLFIRRRFPLLVILIYWILFTFLPTQVLSFAYPVSDRYLFLPSVAATILIASIVINASERLGRRGLIAASVFLLALAFLWGNNTFRYLSEWKDSRSVWYGAKEKSSDPQVYYNLGWHYMDMAARFGTSPRKAPLPETEAKEFASAVWKEDPRLPALLSEFSTGKHNGLTEKAFQEDLRKLAWDDLEQSLVKKERHIMPDLFFHRGLLLLDQGDSKGARKEFLAGIQEASRLAFTEGRQEILINIYYNLGVLEWGITEYKEALRWLLLAEQEQNQFNRKVIPDLTTHRKRLEEIIATLSKK